MQENNISPIANSPQTTEAQPSTVDSRPKTNSFLVILLSILLFISVAIAGYFAFQTQQLVKELTVYRLPSTETPAPIPTSDPTASWKVYTDSINQFTFMYPSNLQIINDLKNIPMNSIHVNVESVDLVTAIKQNEFDVMKLKDVLISGRSTKVFKKGSFERNVNGLIAFFPLNQSQTLIITEYFDAPVTDVTINNEFDQILSTFKFLD